MPSRSDSRCSNTTFTSSRNFGWRKAGAPRKSGAPFLMPSLRPAYKPRFVRRRKAGLRSEEFLPGALPGRSSLCAAYPELERREQRLVPAWPCSRWGLPGRLHCCRRRWSLTPPFHHDRLATAVCFCGPIRQVTSPRGFPGAVPCGVRTFLDPAPKRRTATVQPT